MDTDIGKKIRLLRLSKGMTQEQLADRLAVTAQSVSKWENGVTAPDIMLLPQISVELGVTIDELFSMTDETRLSRIENLLSGCSDSTVIPEKDFGQYRSFLTEHINDKTIRGRVLTALSQLYCQQASGYRDIAALYALEATEYEPEKKFNHSLLCHAWNGADRDWYASEHSKLIDHYIGFVEKHPLNIPALQLLLDNLIADGRADDADEVLKKLRAADSSCRTMAYEARIAQLHGDKDGMERILSDMTERFSDDWLAWAYMGDIYARMADYERASECWTRSYGLQPHPRYTDDLLCLARAAVITGQYSKAASYYNEAVELLKNEHSITEGDGIDELKALADKYAEM